MHMQQIWLILQIACGGDCVRSPKPYSCSFAFRFSRSRRWFPSGLASRSLTPEALGSNGRKLGVLHESRSYSTQQDMRSQCLPTSQSQKLPGRATQRSPSLLLLVVVMLGTRRQRCKDRTDPSCLWSLCPQGLNRGFHAVYL